MQMVTIYADENKFKIGNVGVLYKYNLRKSYSSACCIKKLEDGLVLEVKATGYLRWIRGLCFFEHRETDGVG